LSQASLATGSAAPDPSWRPSVDRAANHRCECGAWKCYGWVQGVPACYGCFRDAERAGLEVRT